MSKFASNAPLKNQHRTFNSTEIKKTVNKGGGVGYTLPAKERLATRIFTSLINEKKFYGDNTQNLLDDLHEVAAVDPEFVLKLAAYARTVMHMRSAPVFTFTHASLINECKPFIRKWAPGIIQRADEPAEVIALLNSIATNAGQKPVIPNSVKKGLADVIVDKFGAYHLMKYKGERNAVNMWDVFNVVHPKAKSEEQAEMFRKFMKGELEAAKTWETTVSQKGSNTQSWEESARVMGYMALLRNLRNFAKNNVSPATVKAVCDRLTDPEQVKRSKQLPFRFFSAYKQLNAMLGQESYWSDIPVITDPKESGIINQFRDAVEEAFDVACAKNVEMPGVTAIFSDHSGSMDSPISEKSTVSQKDIALTLHSMADKANPSNVGMIFGDKAAQVDSKGLSAMRFIEAMRNRNVGWSTNAHLCFRALLKSKVKVDRIILLSDMQCYNSRNGWSGAGDVDGVFAKYQKEVNSNCFLHSVDLAGYGTSVSPLNQKNVCLYAGWTDKFMDLMDYAERGVGSMIQEIEEFQLG